MRGDSPWRTFSSPTKPFNFCAGHRPHRVRGADAGRGRGAHKLVANRADFLHQLLFFLPAFIQSRQFFSLGGLSFTNLLQAGLMGPADGLFAFQDGNFVAKPLDFTLAVFDGRGLGGYAQPDACASRIEQADRFIGQSDGR